MRLIGGLPLHVQDLKHWDESCLLFRAFSQGATIPKAPEADQNRDHRRRFEYPVHASCVSRSKSGQ
jgi:hypothetical protein